MKLLSDRGDLKPCSSKPQGGEPDAVEVQRATSARSRTQQGGTQYERRPRMREGRRGVGGEGLRRAGETGGSSSKETWREDCYGGRIQPTTTQARTAQPWLFTPRESRAAWGRSISGCCLDESCFIDMVEGDVKETSVREPPASALYLHAWSTATHMVTTPGKARGAVL